MSLKSNKHKKSKEEKTCLELTPKHVFLNRRYLQYSSPEYVTIRIVPHKSNRNYNSAVLVKALESTYRTLFQAIRRENDKVIWTTNCKLAHYILIGKRNVQFFFVLPKVYKSMFKEKMRNIWNTSTIKDVENEVFNLNAYSSAYQLDYKYKDAFSLQVDKKSNDTLNSILNVTDMMEADEEILVYYNFMPYYDYNWKSKCKRAHHEFLNGETIVKGFYPTDVINSFINTSLGLVDTLTEVFTNVTLSDKEIKELTDKKKEAANISIADEMRSVLGYKHKEISRITLDKAISSCLKVQVAIVSTGAHKNRTQNNALSLCQGFKVLDGDNELVAKKVNMKHLSFDGYTVGGIKSMICSKDECQNFIQMPGKELLDKYAMDHIDTTETTIPEELLNGYIKLGVNTYKGNSQMTYMSLDPDLASLPLVLVGPMGAGKTFQFKQFGENSISGGDGLVIIDYIRDCELAETIKQITSKERLIDLDLGDEKNFQALAFNEYKLNKSTPFTWAESANLHQQEIVALIDAIYMGDPLSGSMRRYFTSAADIVLINDGMSFKDVIDCLIDATKRKQFIDSIPNALRPMLEERITNLQELDDIDKETGKVTTKFSKIERILDRVGVIREDLRLRMMFNAPASQNIDFADEMDKGKVILIRMPADKYRTKHIRNILTTFYISKIWLACNIRGVRHKEMRKYQLFIDEIFQAPNCYDTVDQIIRQSRKFRLQFVLSAHLLSDLKMLNDGLKSVGTSYLLLQKCDKSNFEFVEEVMKEHGFALEDLLNLKKRHSLNMIACNDGYCVYESDLTVPTKV